MQLAFSRRSQLFFNSWNIVCKILTLEHSSEWKYILNIYIHKLAVNTISDKSTKIV